MNTIREWQQLKPGGTIIWLLRGQEIGRDVLPEKTTGEARRELAYLNGIQEYDNFIFLKTDGAVRQEANSIMLEGEQLGKLCGRKYSEYKKQQDECRTEFDIGLDNVYFINKLPKNEEEKD